MEAVLIYLYFFCQPLVRLGVAEGYAFWIGAFLNRMAIVSFVGIFCVRSVGVRWTLFLYCVAVAVVVPLELARELGKSVPHFQ